jgi:hypothetical protein
MFDLVSTQDLATAGPLILPEYRYGGIGFRGHRQWLPKDNCDFLTSEGKDRSNGHGTRARWCHIGGRIDGQLAGIAILDHPANFRAPQAMRINPDQPFFCYSPSLIGDWKIEPGKPYVSRYRFIVYDGAPDRAELDRLWIEFDFIADFTARTWVQYFFNQSGEVLAKIDGQVELQNVGQLQLAVFPNEAGLEAVGGNLIERVQVKPHS